jgi:transcriptional regulator with XRE-family HTH domain
MDGIGGRQVSERLFEWLEYSGESISEVAEKIRTSRTTLSNLLNGHIERPRLTTVRKLARHFGVSVEEFLAGPKVLAPLAKS